MPSKEAKGFHIFKDEAQHMVGLKSMLRSCQHRPTAASRGASPEVSFLGGRGGGGGGAEPARTLHLAKIRPEAAP